MRDGGARPCAQSWPPPGKALLARRPCLSRCSVRTVRLASLHDLDILLDSASRPLDALEALAPRLTDEVLNAHPAGHPNSVAWLLWHTGREIDAQLAHLTGLDELWTRDGFRERFALGAVGDGVGYGHTAEKARAVVVVDPQLLVEYATAESAAQPSLSAWRRA